MRVLVGCEYSGVVRDAFRRLGHDAWSCDIEPTAVPGPHLQGDVRDVFGMGWDLAILHPPCTHLSVSGARHFAAKQADGRQAEAIQFFMDCINAPIPKIAVENPVCIMSRLYRKPDQIVQPWMFGDNASKATCLWLKGLPKLRADWDKVVPPRGWEKVPYAGPMHDGVIYKELKGILFGTRIDPAPKMLWANQTPSGQNKLGPSPERATIRSKTYLGIAEAMSLAWTLVPEDSGA